MGRERMYPSSEFPGDTASFGTFRTTENPHVIPQKYFSYCSLLIWLLFYSLFSLCVPVPAPLTSSSPPQLTYLPPPWGECEAKALGFFHVYSVTACRIDCETRYIVENCNCRMVHMPGRQRPWRMPAGRFVLRVHAAVSVAGDASYCTPEQYKDCAEPALGRSAHTLTSEAPQWTS